jgi:hypothetical protein
VGRTLRRAVRPLASSHGRMSRLWQFGRGTSFRGVQGGAPARGTAHLCIIRANAKPGGCIPCRLRFGLASVEHSLQRWGGTPRERSCHRAGESATLERHAYDRRCGPVVWSTPRAAIRAADSARVPRCGHDAGDEDPTRGGAPRLGRSDVSSMVRS